MPNNEDIFDEPIPTEDAAPSMPTIEPGQYIYTYTDPPMPPNAWAGLPFVEIPCPTPPQPEAPISGRARVISAATYAETYGEAMPAGPEPVEPHVFKVGDRVYLNSAHYGDTECNPVWRGRQGKIKGTIAQIDSDESTYDVAWDNGTENTYDSVYLTPLFIIRAGDKVIARDKSPYVVTRAGWKGKVLKLVNEATVIVRGEDGSEHTVLSKYFDKYVEPIKKECTTPNKIDLTRLSFGRFSLEEGLNGIILRYKDKDHNWSLLEIKYNGSFRRCRGIRDSKIKTDRDGRIKEVE